MKIYLKEDLIKEIGIRKLKPFDINEDSLEWNHEIEMDLILYDLKQTKKLRSIIEPFPSIRGTKTILKDIDTWIELHEKKEPKIQKLEHFETMLQEFLLHVDGYRIYEKDQTKNDAWLCSRVTEIRYHEKQSSGRGERVIPAHVDMTYIFDKFGGRHEMIETWHVDEVIHKTVSEILANKGYYKETPELRKYYLEKLQVYKKTIPLIGSQYYANGVATEKSDNQSYYSNSNSSRFVMNDKKVVVDIFREGEEDSYREREHAELGIYFWESVKHASKIPEKDYDWQNEKHEAIRDKEKAEKRREEEDVEERTIVEVPVHPIIVVFDLQSHRRLAIHIDFVRKYKYDKNLSEKLVLPKQNKDLVKILIKHKDGGFTDIIKGKTGGAIILLTGQAGVGKTLTAEVFAEASERPLYSVQASQLGVTVEQLENELKLVLSRASRWNAILLLDEADVYVHERGNNLNQNAIVGVFLRVLEYHSSILFMTTNRPDIVDDAIASRCIARIDYKYPDKDQQKQIWRILADTSKINVSDKVIEEFVDSNNNFSGRDIKNILKLVNLKTISEKSEITKEAIEFVSRFNPTFVKREGKAT